MPYGPQGNAINISRRNIIKIWDEKSGVAWSYTDPGTGWTRFIRTSIYIPYSARCKPKRLTVIQHIYANETGTKGIRLYNYTDAVALASLTWTGTSNYIAVFDIDISAWTAVKQVDIEFQASSATEDVTLDMNCSRWFLEYEDIGV